MITRRPPPITPALIPSRLQEALLLTSAAGGCPRPGAVSLAQPDARSLNLKIWLASHGAGRIKVVVANVLDEKGVFWQRQRWTVHNWEKNREDEK